MFTLYTISDIDQLVYTATSTELAELIECARKRLEQDDCDWHFAVIMEQRIHVLDNRSVTCSMEFRWHGHRSE